MDKLLVISISRELPINPQMRLISFFYPSWMKPTNNHLFTQFTICQISKTNYKPNGKAISTLIY
jgi:hypothetical protein